LHSGGLDIHHFATPVAPIPGAAGFSLAVLREGESPELISGGYQLADDDLSYLPSIGILYAREQVDGSTYRIRAALALEKEFFVSTSPIDGTPFGGPARSVAAITRSRDRVETYFNVIDGAAWKVVARCKLPVAAAAAKIAPDMDGGPLRLYLQDPQAIHVYSLPDFDDVRTIEQAGDSGFDIAQLDDDPAEEIVLANPPLILDAVTGLVEASYSAGAGNGVVAGRFGIDGHDGFLARDFLGVHVWSGFPYTELWTIPQEEFTSYPQLVTVADIDNDGVDEFALADGYLVGLQSVYSVRVFNAATQALIDEDIEPLYPNILSFALLRDGHGTMQVIAALENYQGLRVHALGAPSPAWEDPIEAGPFVAAAGSFVDAAQPSIAYGGVNGPNRPRVHIVDAATWQETQISPPNGDPNAIPLQKMIDLLSVESGVADLDRLAVGGQQTWGSVATVAPLGWPLVWQIGDEASSLDAPLGQRTVERLAAYDVNGDGVDDVLVGAGEYGGSESGIMVAAFDGVDGSLLWRSPGLGGLYPHVLAMQIARVGSVDLLLVAGTEALRTFDPVSGTLLHTQPGWAGAVAATSDGEIVAAASDGTLRVFDERLKLLRKRHLEPPIYAIAQPAADAPLLVVARSGLRWLDSFTDQSALPLATPSGFAGGNRWLLTYDASTRSLDIIAGSQAGLYEVTTTVPRSDRIFGDGLD
jgi:hypothetical protein